MVYVFTTVIMFYCLLFWTVERFNKMAREQEHKPDNARFSTL
jgi:hypothetical protein